MNASHLLVWFEDGQPRMCELAEVPDTLTYKGEMFQAETGYFGDVDYLRDEQKMLVGFAYILGGERGRVLWERLLSLSENVKLEGILSLIVLESRPYEIECVQAMGTEVYCAPSGQIMLAIPNWDFGELAFKLTTTDTPLNVPSRRS